MIEYKLKEQQTMVDISFLVDINSKNVDELKTDVFSILDEAPNCKTIHLDMTKITKVDSVGLNFLVSIVERMKENQGVVKASISSKPMRRILEFTRMVDLMEVNDSTDDA